MQVDLIITNANIHTMNQDHPHATSLAILGERVVAVDDLDGLQAARTVDLGGRTITPGFHDAHNHMTHFGMQMQELALSSPGVKDLDEVYALVAKRAAELPEGSWIIGSGYDQNKLGGAHPTRQRLDEIAPRHRVWLKHTSAHMAVVNGMILDEVDIEAAPPGGEVVKDSNGRPTGLLQEQAQALVQDLVRPYPQQIIVDALARASVEYAAEGLVGVHEAGIGGGWVGNSPVEFAAYQQARDDGLLKQRVTVMVVSDSIHDLARAESDGPAKGIDLGIRTGLGDNRLRIGAMKLFSDGSLLGHTAAMCEDFANGPGEVGFLQEEIDSLHAKALGAHRAGWQIAAHAIGDRAVGVVLDIFEDVLAKYPRENHRHRIEHCGVCRPEYIERIAKLGLIPVPQGRFVEEIGDGMAAALGSEREGWAYRFRSFLDAGITVPGSSDRPVVLGAPLLGIQAMVNRRTESGAILGPDEIVSVQDALRCYTYGSTYAAFLENESGSVEAGKLADLVVLSEDILAVDPATIGQIEVLVTMVGGELTHGALEG